MTPPTLNLLPPERRHSFDEVVLFTAIRKILVSLGVFLAIACAALFAGRYFLIRQIAHQQAQTADVVRQTSSNGASLDEQIRLFNIKLTQVNQVQQGYVQWTPILKEFFSTVPQGILLSQIEIDTQQKMVLARGNAAQRDALLAWQDALTKSTYFSDPSSPLSNLLQRENIIFELHASLKLP